MENNPTPRLRITSKIKNFYIKIILSFLLSWFFAFCSQIIIPLPFNFVPISLQPLPVLLSSLIFGWTAVFAYLLTILQATFGAPFFSGFEGGIIKLLGPTGGYIFGFLFSMIFLIITKNVFNSYIKNKILINTLTFLKLSFAVLIYYIFGLLQLSLFVPYNKLLYLGFYPFIIGDLIKISLITIWINYFRN